MKKLLYFLPLLFLSFFSCKKNKSDNNLQNYALGIKIIPISIYAQNAVLSFIGVLDKDGYVYQLQMKKSIETDAEWKEIKYTNRDSIPVMDLSPKTKYDVRISLTNGGETKYSSIYNFTSRSFDIDFGRYFASPYKIHDDFNALFSIEGATHTLYGKGFSNESSIKVSLIPVDNPQDKIMLDAIIQSDSQLSFTIPKDLIANSPYLRNKTYSCVIGDVPFIGYGSFLNGTNNISGDLTVVNKDIEINKFAYVASSCPILTFSGSFGTHQITSLCPDVLFNSSMTLRERRVVIRLNGNIVKDLTINALGSPVCDGDGQASVDPTVINKPIILYHEVTSFSIRTKMGAGSYTAQIVQTTLDGAEYASNQFPFTL